ncbi:hypothetical protein CDD82_498 [Ophiocordyceps australis]|uniref:Uncharacterized protein n=1 Tax=Ophiocordyceps australis TaxID=1399860 RepID=A0A2C5YLD7_9HYPO|nr:hypothetical protein CDD82_498 [Ophiocordyceps australis]
MQAACLTRRRRRWPLDGFRPASPSRNLGHHQTRSTVRRRPVSVQSPPRCLPSTAPDAYKPASPHARLVLAHAAFVLLDTNVLHALPPSFAALPPMPTLSAYALPWRSTAVCLASANATDMTKRRIPVPVAVSDSCHCLPTWLRCKQGLSLMPFL